VLAAPTLIDFTAAAHVSSHAEPIRLGQAVVESLPGEPPSNDTGSQDNRFRHASRGQDAARLIASFAGSEARPESGVKGAIA
jgi:hypothetical protein